MPDDARVPACMESAFRHIARRILAGVAGHSGKEGAAAVVDVVGVLRLPDADRASAHRRTSARGARIPERDYGGGAAGARVDNLGGTQSASATDRKSTRLNSSHSQNSYAVFCLKKKKSRG